MTDQVEVWLDADFLERTRVGTLTHDRGTLRFVYEPEWLKNSQAFALDPDLSLGEGTYFPNAEAGNFRVFDDSRPSLATVIETSEWYVESKDRGAAIVAEVLHETRPWRRTAQALNIARADIELTAAAFAESDAASS